MTTGYNSYENSNITIYENYSSKDTICYSRSRDYRHLDYRIVDQDETTRVDLSDYDEVEDKDLF